MNKSILEGLGKLLRVKSLVTLALTAVFSVMALRGEISQEFMTVYAVVIAFYFGTQSQKAPGVKGGPGGLQPGEVQRLVLWTGGFRGRLPLVHGLRPVGL